MIRLVLFLAAAVAVSLLAAWLANHPGAVALTWQGVHVETSFAVLMIAVLLFGALLAVGLPRGWSPPPPATPRRPRR